MNLRSGTVHVNRERVQARYVQHYVRTVVEDSPGGVRVDKIPLGGWKRKEIRKAVDRLVENNTIKHTNTGYVRAQPLGS